MRIILQRCLTASVEVDQKEIAKINQGFLILLGIETEDSMEDVDWLVNKINGMRIFNDADDKMNLSIHDIKGSILVVSQFTLHSSTKKGNRPSYIKAAKPDLAVPLYENFIKRMKEVSKIDVQHGVFGADMKVHLINDGPVTIFMDSKNKE